MARTQTVSVTVRLPVGIVSILDEAVEKGMFVSTSDAIRALVRRSIQDAGPELGRGTSAKRNKRIGTIQACDEQQNDDSTETQESDTTEEQQE